MAFGISKEELSAWKRKAERGEIAIITHFWRDDRFPNMRTVTKAACSDRQALVAWGQAYGLKSQWIHDRAPYPHFDLFGDWQCDILKAEGLEAHMYRFNICTSHVYNMEIKGKGDHADK
ncbi:hypothetical protein B0H94_101244 [Salsuginibacillus halophilus]|uniref:Uncharacterized protein n=1 Tax=Salsuginibacillus halophilus TaxID=517424 RepID=A0A2P8HYM7_9BACI|nr:hypothetical protein [Salsuginibacillus halophilus]PSL51330.1 hypothetical protein B0H94_101244 [Salsuginibacillus halophilus]